MAIVQLSIPFEEIHGAVERKGIVHRRKTYRDADGRIVSAGCQEAYVVRHPRDYRKNPPRGAELRNLEVFREANRLTSLILHAEDTPSADSAASASPVSPAPPASLAPQDSLTSSDSPDYRALLASYRLRFQAQLCRPDLEAPFDSRTHSRRRYHTLPTFIRALLIRHLHTTPP